MKFQPTLRWSKGWWFGVCVDFEPTLVETLKAFPVRAWDAASKTWWFPNDVYHQVLKVIRYYQPDVQDISTQSMGVLAAAAETMMAKEAKPQDHYGVLGLVSQATDEVVGAAYKALCSTMPPEELERVRYSYEQIMRERSL